MTQIAPHFRHARVTTLRAGHANEYFCGLTAHGLFISHCNNYLVEALSRIFGLKEQPCRLPEISNSCAICRG
jgi:hypothetical protein